MFLGVQRGLAGFIEFFIWCRPELSRPDSGKKRRVLAKHGNIFFGAPGRMLFAPGFFTVVICCQIRAV
jgi:hypothetical protein